MLLHTEYLAYKTEKKIFLFSETLYNSLVSCKLITK